MIHDTENFEDRVMKAISHDRIRLTIAALLLLNIAATAVVFADEMRHSTTTHYSKAERARGAAGTTTDDAFAPLQTAGARSGGKRSLLQSSVGATATAPNTEFWFYTADVVLFNDHDRDGHFHGIDLLFDVDTYYDVADVYAVVYLSLEGGPWNEYAATDNFTLFGASADDEYVIVTELLSGYPTGSYDLLIELFDAYDDRFLASYGPADTSELAFLPLEDAHRDEPYTTTVVVTEGGGSLGWWVLLVLLVASRVASIRSPESKAGSESGTA